MLDDRFMIASPRSPRSLALPDRGAPAFSRIVNRVVGDLLELMVHSIEGLRDRIAASLRRDQAM